jgi:hypothetical protein
MLPVRRNSDRSYTIAVAFQRTQGLLALEIPKPQSSVIGPRDPLASIGRDGDRSHTITVTSENSDRLATLQVPNTQRLVCRPR